MKGTGHRLLLVALSTLALAAPCIFAGAASGAGPNCLAAFASSPACHDKEDVMNTANGCPPFDNCGDAVRFLLSIPADDPACLNIITFVCGG